MVDKKRTGLGASQGAIGTQHDRTQIVVVTYAAKHHVSALGCFAGRGGTGVAGELCTPIFGFGRVAVVNRDLVASQCQVARHGVAHDTQANESHFGGVAGFIGFGIGAGHG